MNHSVLQAVIKLASSESSAQRFKQGVYLSIETAKVIRDWDVSLPHNSWILLDRTQILQMLKTEPFRYVCVSDSLDSHRSVPHLFWKAEDGNNQVLLVDFEIDLLVPKASPQLIQWGSAKTMSFPSFVNICGSKARIFTWTKWNHWLGRVERCSKYLLYIYIYHIIYVDYLVLLYILYIMYILLSS